MDCIICGGNKFEIVFSFSLPDKYESCMGIQSPHRTWEKCESCGHYQQKRAYPIEWLEKIYEEKYRSRDFRGVTIDDSFWKIVRTDADKSENFQRANWVEDHLPLYCFKLLDIGSGIGVFPYEMKQRGLSVTCTEINRYSIEFINNILQMACYRDWKGMKADVVSLIHVLEHIEDPEDFLIKLREVTDCLVIEVPDCKTFEKNTNLHDDFNSCHVHLFNSENLGTLVKKAGYSNYFAENIHYPHRDLDRIMMVAEC